MKKDYHVHPMIMKKSLGNFEQFVQKEVSEGVDEICITDHMPLKRFDGNEDRIPLGKVKEYCELVQKLREDYRGVISIKCGIEIDYHDSLRSHIEEILNTGKFDFVLGSSHVGVINPRFREEYQSPDEYAIAVYNNVLNAAKSGYFTTISHLDQFRNLLVNYSFNNEVKQYSYSLHLEKIIEILDVVKKNDLYLEINPRLFMLTGKVENTYPQPEILTLALERNVKFSYGSDAHFPNECATCLKDLRTHELYGKAIAQWEA